jgi:hypothetical protein
MGLVAATSGDRIDAIDMHLIQPPGTVPPTPVAHPFSGVIDGGLSADVCILGSAAATVGSTARNTPSHLPTRYIVSSPSNQGTIRTGSTTVFIDGSRGACHRHRGYLQRPDRPAVGKVVARGSTVFIG